MFGGLGDMMGMLGNLNKMTSEYQKIMDGLKDERIEAAAGGEQVKATVNGLGEVVAVKISPEAMASGDTEMLEDLIVSAIASAVEQSRTLSQEKMGKLGEVMPLGSLKAMLDQVKPQS